MTASDVSLKRARWVAAVPVISWIAVISWYIFQILRWILRRSGCVGAVWRFYRRVSQSSD